MAATDAYFNLVSLLMRGEDLTDSSPSPKTLTDVGAVVSATDWFKYGSASLKIPSGSHLDITQTSAFAVGNGDFTLEGVFRADATQGYGMPFCVGSYGFTNGFYLGFDTTTPGAGTSTIYFGSLTPSATVLVSTTVPTTQLTSTNGINVCIQRANGVSTLYVEGVSKGTSTAGYNVTAPDRVRIGAMNAISNRDTIGFPYVGWIDELRFTNAARYSGNYAVQTAQWPGAATFTPTTWNPSDKGASVALSNGNLTENSNYTGSVRTVYGASAGKWYFEVLESAGPTSALVGIGTSQAQVTGTGVYPGSDIYGWGMYFNNGNKYHNGANSAYGSAVALNTIIGVLADLDTGTLAFTKAGVSLGTAYTGIPAGTYFPMAGGGGSGTADTLVANFGATPFTYSIPAGYNPGFGSPTTTITGNVKGVSGANAACKLYFFREDTGALMGSTTSNASTGNYSFTTAYNGTHLVVCMPQSGDNTNALVFRAVLGA